MRPEVLPLATQRIRPIRTNRSAIRVIDFTRARDAAIQEFNLLLDSTSLAIVARLAATFFVAEVPSRSRTFERALAAIRWQVMRAPFMIRHVS
jgi:hypothetical protein